MKISAKENVNSIAGRQSPDEDLRRKDLHKYYKYVKTCLSCKKKYGSDKPNTSGELRYCSECSGKMKSLTYMENTHNHKMKGGV